MLTLDEQIKTGSFAPYYLICGTDSYLKQFAKKRLLKALLADDDGMNLNEYEGRGIDLAEIKSISDTLPFFAEHRVIVLTGTGFFKNQSDMPELLEAMPESTTAVFMEDEVDKRNRLYKMVAKSGCVIEQNGMDDDRLAVWSARYLGQAGKKVTRSTVNFFLQRTGPETAAVRNDLEKLIAYAGERDVITQEDVDALCPPRAADRIFDMIDAITNRQQQKAMRYFNDLLTLRESPSSILYLLSRQYHLLLCTKKMVKEKKGRDEIAEALGIRSFVADRCTQQARRMSQQEISSSLSACIQAEEDFKCGRITDAMAVILLLISCSSRKELSS